MEQALQRSVLSMLRLSDEALRRSEAEVVIDELTALPKNPSDMAAAAPDDRKLRLEGGGNLHRAALATGVRRYLQQASGFPFALALAWVTSPMAWQSVQPHLWQNAPGLTPNSKHECWVLRAWRGSCCVMVSFTARTPGTAPKVPLRIRSADRKFQLSVKERASGRGYTLKMRPWRPSLPSSLLRACTTSLMTTPPPSMSGCRHSPMASVLRPLPEITEQVALEKAGPDAVYYGTKLRGASNAKRGGSTSNLAIGMAYYPLRESERG